jgi:putative transposase
MAQSLSKLFVHIIFHIKIPATYIRNAEKDELYAYMGAIIKDNKSIPILINGVKDHVHILCVMSKNISLSKLVEEIKRHSSRWIKSKGRHYINFAWQGGYGGFSVSPSLQDKTKNYIRKQEEHHKKMTFKEEYLLFLKEYKIEYNENYLWHDE